MEDNLSTDELLAKLNSDLDNLNFAQEEYKLDELEDNISKDIEVLQDAKKCLYKLKEKNYKNIQRRKKYTIKIKKAVLALVKYNISRHSIEKDYGITRKTIREWEQQKEEIFKEKKIKNID